MTRNMKKIASVLLAVAMLVSCFTFTGSAAEAQLGEEAMAVGLALSAESANPGDTITVTISISNNYNATAMRWPVLYSKDFFEVVDGSLTTPIDSAVVATGTTTYGDNDGFVPAEYADTHSAFVIQWRANPSDDGVMGAFNSGVATQCFTFTLKVLETATGSGTVLIPEDSEFFYNSAITDVNDITFDNLYEADSLTFTVSDPATVAIAAAAEPELVAADGYSVRTIQFDGDDATYLCGFSLEAVDNGGTLEEQFTVNNGSYTVTGDWGTGAVITVLDESGAEYASYTVIIFGDTNGDAMIDNADILNIKLFVSGDLDPSGASYYAADLYADNENSIYIDNSDLSIAALYISGDVESGSLNQAHTAA